MKEKLTKNLDLKILAILFSVILWLVIVNIDDPVKSVQFSDVNVKILNASVLEKQGKVYEVEDGTNLVTVTVIGRRSIIEDLAKENISAVADMRELTEMNTIGISLSSNKYGNELDSIKCDTDSVKLNIEEKKKVQKTIQTEIIGVPAEGYILGDLSVNLNRVNIEGPQSLINRIAYAKATLDVDEVSSNVIASVPIRLYDSKGEVVDSSRITMNISSVSVNQEVLVVKEVPIHCEVTGTPAEGYALTGEIILSRDSVRIAGKKNVVDSVTAITIPGDMLDVTGMKNNYKTIVDISEYLPDNVKFAVDALDPETEVTIGIQKETYTSVPFDESAIVIKNIPDGMKATLVYDGTYLKNTDNAVRIYGLPAAIAGFEKTNLRFELDFEEYMEEKGVTTLSAGTYWITPKVIAAEGLHLEEPLKFEVKLEKRMN